MKKSLKFALTGAATVAVLGAGITTAVLVAAWGDNSGGRASYTIDQINQGVLGDKIVFNSISDSVIGDEKNYVGAREDTGVNAGIDNVWNGNDITVEDGKTYLIRLYVHNNNPNGTNAVAKDVKTYFNVPTTSGTQTEVNGFITSSNASPSKYWDYVRFNASSNFHLEYVYGSALLENNGVGAGGGVQLSDDIVGTKGVLIGYDSLNGEVPGCYKYASYVTIKVKAVFDDQSYTVEKQVRKVGDSQWQESVNVNIGDEVEYRIHYKNTTSAATTNVMVKDVLPKNMEYVQGTTVLYNATNPKGIARDDTITTTGVNIGGYAVNGDGYVVFRAKAIDKTLTCGDNTVTNWGQVGVGDKTLQDSADVKITKTCEPPTPTSSFTIEKKVRKLGETTWQESVDTKVGDKVEYQITFTNTGEADAEDVVIKDTLPENTKYVAGSTKLYNADHSEGEKQSDAVITDDGLNIGDYQSGETASVVFTAEVYDENLVCGDNTLINWGRAYVGNAFDQDDANVELNKNCDPKPVDPEPTPTPTPTPTPENNTPTVMPSTGPAEIVGGVIGAGALTTATGYYVASRKKLNQ